MIVYIPGIHQPGGQDSINIGELGTQADDSLDNIELQNCLDYVQEQDRPEALKLAISKLKPGGTLKFFGLDFILLGKSLYTCQIEQPSPVIYGGRQSVSTAMRERQLAEALGLKVVTQFIAGDNYTISCEKLWT